MTGMFIDLGVVFIQKLTPPTVSVAMFHLVKNA